MFAVPAMVIVQFILSPLERLPLVWKLRHVPEELVAKVAVSVWLALTSFTVKPTAGLSLMFVESLVGCSPVAVGQLFVQLYVVLSLYVKVWLQSPSFT